MPAPEYVKQRIDELAEFLAEHFDGDDELVVAIAEAQRIATERLPEPEVEP